MFAAPSVHTGLPVVQLVTPCLHAVGFPLQACPVAQPMQLPPELHTRLVPQLVPADFWVPLTQVCAPVLHDVVPLKQTLGLVVQLCPAVHALQVPLPLQTWFVPQVTPADFGVPFTHVWLPVVHDVVPLKQVPGLVVQLWPEVHPMQLPEPLHTWFVPQLVPAERGVPSTHCWLPVLHAVTPLAHAWLGLVVQLEPAVQATQVPLPLQT